MSFTYLSTEDLLHLADRLGVREVRDMGLLDSASLRPQSIVYGVESYPLLPEKAAAMMESIVGNHPLLDGNKRLGWAAVVTFLALNNVYLDVDDDEAYDFTIAVAAGTLRFIDIAERIALWLETNADAELG